MRQLAAVNVPQSIQQCPQFRILEILEPESQFSHLQLQRPLEFALQACGSLPGACQPFKRRCPVVPDLAEIRQGHRRTQKVLSLLQALPAGVLGQNRVHQPTVANQQRTVEQHDEEFVLECGGIDPQQIAG